MDKRKANGTETPENEDRVLKRRRLAEEYDLSKGETRESTSAYGLSFLEQIRRTADKSGRRVAIYFEELPPKASNKEYYKQTRMPISLAMVEKKLNDGEFKNLSELESYFKRMISNAKEFYPRSSTTFDDAERVRKAVSNYMTKTNPAYQTRGYQAVPTPLPPEDGEEPTNGAGEDNVEAGEEAEAEAEEKEDSDDDDDEPQDEVAVNEDEDVGRSSRKRSIILKRRGSTRHRRSPSDIQETPRRTSARFDHNQTQYQGKGFKGLSFQQAQEKIVEDLLNHTEPDYDSAYFEPFINLPPRALRDYYRMIQEPISVKKLQKMVKGVQGRNDATGVSEFKNWAQFEEKMKLLWTNAYYYNEEGSDIYVLAQELETFCVDLLKQATSAVADPVPPKIKLKVGQSADQPTPSKKITIHVGSGGRGGSTEAPNAQAGHSIDSPKVNGASASDAQAQTSLAPVDSTRSVSAAAPSPSPSVPPLQQSEDAASAASPAVRPTSAASGQITPAAGSVPPPLPPQPVVPPAPVIPMEQKRLRAPGKGVEHALISSLKLYATNPVNQADRPVMITILPDAKDMQRSGTITIPPTHSRVTLVTQLPQFLQDRQYSLWTLMDKTPLKPNQQTYPNQHMTERVFEAVLHPGLNVVESHLIAAIPRDERIPGEPEVELEIFTIFVNMMRN